VTSLKQGYLQVIYDEKSRLKTATLELTRSCNFHCGHCYIETICGGGDHLKSEQWLAIIQKLSNLGCGHYILTGGEVLMSSSFIDVYTYLKENKFRVDIFTNGSILKTPHIELFTKYPPDSVSVTVYGQNPSEYSAVTGCNGELHQLVSNNIKTLISLNLAVNLGTIVCTSLTSGLMSLSNEKQCKTELNTYLIPALHGSNNLKLRVEPLKVLQLEIKNQQRNEANRQFYSTLTKMKKNSRDYFKKCPGGYSSIFVSAHGDASICAIYREEAFNLVEDETQMFDVWKALNQVHRNFKAAYFNGQCGQCELNRACRNCPAYSLLETDTTDQNPYLCKLAKLRAAHYLRK
jgi:radical SAM protein with 4Fe4S-binding SPASM domain